VKNVLISLLSKDESMKTHSTEANEENKENMLHCAFFVSFVIFCKKSSASRRA